MKNLVLMFIPALICGVVFTSCNTEKAEPKLITSDGLYVIGTKSGVVPTSITDLVFTDDDIVSFDVSPVGEMVFTKEKTEEIISRARLHSELHFFIDGKPVFSPPIKIYFGWGSLDDIDLQFRISDYNKIYLTDIYQHLDSLLVIDREILEKEFEANRQKRKQEMDVLIKYLSDAGKIVDRTGDTVPPELEEPSLPVTSDTLQHVKTELGGCNLKSSLKNDNTETKDDTVLITVSDESVHVFVGLNYICKEIPFETQCELINDVMCMTIIDTGGGYFRCMCYYTFDFVFKRQGTVNQKYKILLIDPRKENPVILSEGILKDKNENINIDLPQEKGTYTGKIIMNSNPCPPSDFPCVPGIVLWLETTFGDYVLSLTHWIFDDKIIVDGVEYSEGDEVEISGTVTVYKDMHSKEYSVLEIESIKKKSF